MNDLAAPDPDASESAALAKLTDAVRQRAPLDAAVLLEDAADTVVARVLAQLSAGHALRILDHLPEGRRQVLDRALGAVLRGQWSVNREYAEGSVGRLMETPVAVFGLDTTVAEAVARIRELVRGHVFTYGWVIDFNGRLLGVLVMRDLLLASAEDRVGEVMVSRPFSLRPEMGIQDAMRAVVRRHYPVYPVCDAAGRLLGTVPGHALFEEHAFEISAQPGRMVGVEKEEHVGTPWPVSLRFRQPWLQLNLLTAFVAAFVVGLFEHTIEQVVVLAAFLPVLAGQSGNTGCQALAVTLRGMTLGELSRAVARRTLRKEAVLGFANGALVGLTAGAAMYFYAGSNGAASPLALALVVFLAMLASCIISGVTGVLVPLALKRLGADPATASTIFLTTATDVASMGLLLGLATVVVL